MCTLVSLILLSLAGVVFLGFLVFPCDRYKGWQGRSERQSVLCDRYKGYKGWQGRSERQSVLWREWPDYDMTAEAAIAFTMHPRFDLPGACKGVIRSYLRGEHSAHTMEALLDVRMGLERVAEGTCRQPDGKRSSL
jgi:hypothetical protein